MISLLIVSDTHGRHYLLQELLERQLELDDKFRPRHLIHLGDGVDDIEKCKASERFCIHEVRGNCDGIFYLNVAPKERIIELGGYKILAMHGHAFSVKSGEDRAVEYAAKLGADMLLYGHTHVKTSYTLRKGVAFGNTVLNKDVLVANPGSLGYDGSFGVVTISDAGMDFSFGSIK